MNKSTHHHGSLHCISLHFVASLTKQWSSLPQAELHLLAAQTQLRLPAHTHTISKSQLGKILCLMQGLNTLIVETAKKNKQ